jgi:hypothetical protein
VYIGLIEWFLDCAVWSPWGLKTEPVPSFETALNFKWPTLRHIPEDGSVSLSTSVINLGLAKLQTSLECENFRLCPTNLTYSVNDLYLLQQIN